MKQRIARFVALAAVAGVTLAAGLGIGAGAPAAVTAYTPRVTIIDNDGTFMPGDEGTGQWSYAPYHMTVTKGESIVFDNPQGNFRPHTVTSITWTGAFPNRTLAQGTAFNSSPDMASLLTPGSSFTLSTADLDPGHYLYYCALHPWMVGNFTVTP